MSFSLRSHPAFQRAALFAIAAGGGAALVSHLLDRPAGRQLLTLVVGATLLRSIAREVRARTAPGVDAAGLWLPALLVAAGALGLAWLAWPALLGGFALRPAWADGDPALWAAFGESFAGALFGLVGSVGLLGAHLERTGHDEVERAHTIARAGLAPAERGLAERALVAYRRLGAGLTGDASKDARRLDETARKVVLEVMSLAGRASALRAELGAIDKQELGTRAAELEGAASATADPAARADFARAAGSVVALGEHVAELDAAADRVRARLALQVVALETTAMALATRRASAVADEALQLAPLVERLSDAGAELRAEAAALAELGAPAR